MLVSFSVENYRSIRSKQTLRLEQDTSISDGDDPIISTEDDLPNLLRAVAIYGANASGKSNLLRAIHEMRAFILASAKELSKGDKINVLPFLLDDESKDNPSRFEIEFISGGVRYEYGYAANKQRVVEEFLNAYPKRVKQTWFRRKLIDDKTEYEWTFSSYFKGEKETIKNSTRSNALFFSTAVQLNNEMLADLQAFFAKKLCVEHNQEVSDSHTKKFMKNHNDGKERVKDFLKKTDTGIDDFNIEYDRLKEEQVETLLEGLPRSVTDDEKEKIRKKLLKEEMMSVRSVHINPVTKQSVEFSLDYESVGTLKLLSMAGLWLNALDTGQTLFVDEIENSLHCRLVGYLIKLFNNPETNPNGAQLVFTTHSSVALDSNEMRRDQIWFTKKDTTLQSIFYPLLKARIGGKLVRKDEKRIKAYLKGEYSGVPDIDKKHLLT